MAQDSSGDRALSTEELLRIATAPDNSDERRRRLKLGREVLEATDAARELFFNNFIRDIEDNARKAGRPLPDAQETVREASELGQKLESELQDVLALLPEADRASYLAGFLQHHDLLRTVNANGEITYRDDPNIERPNVDLYVPGSIDRSR